LIYPSFWRNTAGRPQEIDFLMQGPDIYQETLFGTALPEQQVPHDYPLRPICNMINKAQGVDRCHDKQCIMVKIWAWNIAPYDTNRSSAICGLITHHKEGLPIQPDKEQTNQRVLWLVEVDWRLAQDSVCGP